MSLGKITNIGALAGDVAAVKAGAGSGSTSGGGFNWGGLLNDALGIAKDVIGSSSSATSNVNVPGSTNDENQKMLLIGGGLLLLVLCLKK